MINIEQVEDFNEFYVEVGHYFKEHFESCEEPRAGKQEINMDASSYQQLMDLGLVHFFLIKDDEDIVGYGGANTAPSLLFSAMQATVDFLYILPEHRNKNYAAKAIHSLEERFKSEGIYDMNLFLPEKEYSSSVADALGYAKTSSIYNKYLGE